MDFWRRNRWPIDGGLVGVLFALLLAWRIDADLLTAGLMVVLVAIATGTAIVAAEQARGRALVEQRVRERREAELAAAARERGAECLRHIGAAASALLDQRLRLGVRANPLEATIVLDTLANGEPITLRSLASVGERLADELYPAQCGDLGDAVAELGDAFDRATTRWTPGLEPVAAQATVERIVTEVAAAGAAAWAVWARGNELIATAGYADQTLQLRPAFALLGERHQVAQRDAEQLEQLADPAAAAAAARERQETRDRRRERQLALQTGAAAAAEQLLESCTVAIRAQHAADDLRATLDRFSAATVARSEMHGRTVEAVQAAHSAAIDLLNKVNELPSRLARGGTDEQAAEDLRTAIGYLERRVAAVRAVAIS